MKKISLLVSVICVALYLSSCTLIAESEVKTNKLVLDSDLEYHMMNYLLSHQDINGIEVAIKNYDKIKQTIEDPEYFLVSAIAISFYQYLFDSIGDVYADIVELGYADSINKINDKAILKYYKKEIAPLIERGNLDDYSFRLGAEHRDSYNLTDSKLLPQHLTYIIEKYRDDIHDYLYDNNLSVDDCVVSVEGGEIPLSFYMESPYKEINKIKFSITETNRIFKDPYLSIRYKDMLMDELGGDLN